MSCGVTYGRNVSPGIAALHCVVTFGRSVRCCRVSPRGLVGFRRNALCRRVVFCLAAASCLVSPHGLGASGLAARSCRALSRDVASGFAAMLRRVLLCRTVKLRGVKPQGVARHCRSVPRGCVMCCRNVRYSRVLPQSSVAKSIAARSRHVLPQRPLIAVLSPAGVSGYSPTLIRLDASGGINPLPRRAFRRAMCRRSAFAVAAGVSGSCGRNPSASQVEHVAV